MEKMMYELRPHFYLLAAFYALVISRTSPIMVLSGLMLLGCGLWVLRARSDYRRRRKLRRLQGRQ
ncbi:MAG: hypothetical protein NDJ89_04760 [Oligoflexia bacterium]|nr:hypothetical protein [Oligoflexia bacterium]